MIAKRRAAEKAVDAIQEGMVIGLGTGSTAYWAIQKLGEKVREGLCIKAVASSLETENLAREAGIQLVSFSQIGGIDLTIDGADEVDASLNLIKGGGGALLREKILAGNSNRFVVIVDETKLVNTLGRFPLPVEIVPFAAPLTVKKLQQFAPKVQLRMKQDRVLITDNGNHIADCFFQSISDPAGLNKELSVIPGVVETGLFLHPMVHSVIVGHENGKVTVMEK